MGSGRWSVSTYAERAAVRAGAGKDAFDYHAVAVRTGRMRVHQTLDPHGLGVRESRDSAEHPDSNAIIIGLDVTGSMDRVVRGIHGNLPRLHELLLGHNYIPHPQVLFAAVGDATCDQIPLQVGQFESDNRMDENLENMILEGGGGGQKTESYELMLYVAARHTAIDCWEKRRRKGYLFLIGDEMAYPVVNRREVQASLGGALQADVMLAEIVGEAQQRYHVYFVIPGGASHGTDQAVLAFWRRALGSERVIQLDNPEDTSECIALTIGLNERTVNLDNGIDHLEKVGVLAQTLDRLRRALGSLFSGGPEAPEKLRPAPLTMSDRRAIMVVGLAFGDCGKGGIVDFLTCTTAAHTVVRFNGGPQAGHNVVTGDGRHHTFSQFGSGTFVPGVQTLLSRFMLIEPYAMIREAEHLAQLDISDAWQRLLIDERCAVITPAHQAANRLRELARGPEAHGTCGLGVGEAMLDLIECPELMLQARDLHDRARVSEMLRLLCDRKREQTRPFLDALQSHPKAGFSIQTLMDTSWMETAVATYSELAARAWILNESTVRSVLCDRGTSIYEGAQGVLLDADFGFSPYTTWSATTFANAETLLRDARYDGQCTRIGVLRSYMTRHGAGPFITEDNDLRARLSEPHNDDTGWQGSFRVGLFDVVAARYALAAVGGVDALAITHLDRHPLLPPLVCSAYDAASVPACDAADRFRRVAGRITEILADRPFTEECTSILRRCRPAYERQSVDDCVGFLNTLEQELETPIAITSFGPRAGDKRLSSAEVLY